MAPPNKKFRGNNNSPPKELSMVEKQQKKNADSSDPTERVAAILDGTSSTSSMLELVISQIKTRCYRYAAKHNGVIGILEIQAIASSHLVGSAASWLDTFMRPKIEQLFDEEGQMVKAKLPMRPEVFLDALRTEYHEEQSKFGLSLEVGSYFQKNQSFDRYRSGFRTILAKYAQPDTMEQEPFIVKLFRRNTNLEYHPIVANIKTYKDIDEIVPRPEIDAMVQSSAKSFRKPFNNNNYRNNNNNNHNNNNNNNNNNRNRNNNGNRSQSKWCHSCKTKTHWTRECRSKKKGDPKFVLSFSNSTLKFNVNVKGLKVERLWVTLQGMSRQPALLDSACEANFVHTSLVKHLDVHQCSPIAVYSADNSFMATITQYISLIWQEMNMTIKFFLADISKYPVVLGAEISTLFRKYPDNIHVIPMNIDVLTPDQITNQF
ncbi:hypothetical protein JA1_005450 [Spathaspora sp. JA1]|nr:hypothetical protein JA1_005450 [Spathaspora sp. JA1]